MRWARENQGLLTFLAFAILAIAVVYRLEDTRDDVAAVSEANRQTICTAGRFLGPPVRRDNEGLKSFLTRQRAYRAFQNLLLQQNDCKAVVEGLTSKQAGKEGVDAGGGDNSPSGLPDPPSGGDGGGQVKPPAPGNGPPSNPPEPAGNGKGAVDVELPGVPVGVCVPPLVSINC